MGNGLVGGKISTPADQLKLNRTFTDWMKEHENLKTIVEEGKGKLQWERDIPSSALSNLETLASTNFKDNLGKIINDQVGLSRATTGAVIACLFKEFQINASFEGLVETVPGVNLDLLKMDKYTMDPSK